jgi:ParB/RepB/Spo0J family partition protein
MDKTIELFQIDTCYELLRLKNIAFEKKLLASISEQGIQMPLQGVLKNNTFIMIDGFKRYRCCKKLKIDIVPIKEIGSNNIEGILNFMRASNEATISILEQAKLVDELHDEMKMTVRDIAHSVSKSPAWVSARLGMISKLTPKMYELIQADHFPARTYMYTLNQLTRVNNIPTKEVEEFIEATSNKGLSGKDLDLLAHGYFKGSDKIRSQIKNGNLSWTMNKLKNFQKEDYKLNPDENRIHRDLDIAGKYMGRIIFKLPSLKEKSKHFNSTAGILAEGILDKIDGLKNVLTNYVQEVEYDKSPKKNGNISSLQRGDESNRVGQQI